MRTSLTEWIDGGDRTTLCGWEIFHRQDGPADGHPVTLVHGFPTSSHDWADIVPALVDAGHRVTTLDLLGYGASAKPRDHRYRIEEQASIVEALWERLGITSTALVAHDYGVTVAQELLARNSDRIERMVWFNGGLYADLYRPIAIQKLLLSPIGPVLATLATERSYRGTLRRTLGRPVSDDDLHDMWLATSANGGRYVQRPLMQYIEDRRTNAVRWQGAHENYGGPTMFVWGPADPISGGHVLPRLRERLPDAQFAVLDGPQACGHYPHVENPYAVNEHLVRFLAR